MLFTLPRISAIPVSLPNTHPPLAQWTPQIQHPGRTLPALSPGGIPALPWHNPVFYSHSTFHSCFYLCILGLSPIVHKFYPGRLSVHFDLPLAVFATWQVRNKQLLNERINPSFSLTVCIFPRSNSLSGVWEQVDLECGTSMKRSSDGRQWKNVQVNVCGDRLQKQR